MAVSKRITRLLHSKRGDAAIEFIMVTAMLILTFSALITALVYVTQVYNASYITRQAVRYIETTGEYNEQAVLSLVNELGGNALSGRTVKVEASYFKGKKIQLRNSFTVTLSAKYPIRIVQFGSQVFTLNLPITIKLKGRSEVYWK